MFGQNDISKKSANSKYNTYVFTNLMWEMAYYITMRFTSTWWLPYHAHLWPHLRQPFYIHPHLPRFLIKVRHPCDYSIMDPDAPSWPGFCIFLGNNWCAILSKRYNQLCSICCRTYEKNNHTICAELLFFIISHR